MSSPLRSPSPFETDDLMDFLGTAMETPSSPIRELTSPSRKRKPTTDGNSSDDEDGDENQQLPNSNQDHQVARSRNLVERITRYATRKRLRPDQVSEVEKFVHEEEAVQRAKLYVEALATQNLVDNIITQQPAYTVSKDLKKNIDSYAWAIILSTTIRTYKGSGPVEHLSTILKRLRFDMPAGIEHNPANWEKVTNAVESALTQVRSTIKKAIRASVTQPAVKKKDGKKTTEHEPLAPAKSQNILELTQHLVTKTQLTPSAALCARIAFMRAIWFKDSSETFWDTLDNSLVQIYKKADDDEKKVRKAFEACLNKDRRTYGVDNGYKIPDNGSNFQRDVDDMVTVEAANTASSTDPDASTQPAVSPSTESIGTPNTST
ncbi:hypothetical protein PQX77_015697 [Marasmius sp. AFHP31]|nr:hypothetical protein PQX77_015697 [Marasmius sp. AFHP31]